MIRLVNERDLHSDFELYLDIECVDTAVGNNNNPCHFDLFQNKRSDMISLTSEETIISYSVCAAMMQVGDSAVANIDSLLCYSDLTISINLNYDAEVKEL